MDVNIFVECSGLLTLCALEALTSEDDVLILIPSSHAYEEMGILILEVCSTRLSCQYRSSAIGEFTF